MNLLSSGTPATNDKPTVDDDMYRLGFFQLLVDFILDLVATLQSMFGGTGSGNATD